MEELELTDPVVVPEKVTNKYHVISMNLDMETAVKVGGEPGLVVVRLKDNNNERITCQYEGKEAIDLMKWMNTANFTVNSMHKKVLQKLTNDGKIPAGTVTGAPDASTPA